MSRMQNGGMCKRKVQVQNEETISVTASVTSSGCSKEGMKGIIFGLSMDKRLLLEQNQSLQKRVEKLEYERVIWKGGENVEPKTFKKHLKERPFNCTEGGCGKAFTLRKDLVKHISQVHLKSVNDSSFGRK